MDHFPHLNTKDERMRRGKKDWQRIYQYLFHKQDVMVLLILPPTFYCANHTRGSICLTPAVANMQLDCH